MAKLTVDMLCKCTRSVKKKRDETQEQFLSRLTHVYCFEKNVEDMSAVSHCRSALVLYMYDNQIAEIKGLSHCPLLAHLYLQNNCIKVMSNLDRLKKLTKLYLGHNCISVVEGLEGLTQLTELHIHNQRLPKGEKLLFEPRTLASIAPTLAVLNVSGNRLDTLEDLGVLVELQQLIASDNSIGSMKRMSKSLSRWPKLWKLELLGNPITSRFKYRDRTITMCHKIEVLDGKKVSENERQFLFNWKAMRKARHKQLIQQSLFDNEDDVEVVFPPSHSYIPPTRPFLPARSSMRLQHMQHKRKQRQQEKLSSITLPPLPTSERPVNMSTFKNLSLNDVNQSALEMKMY